MIAPLGAPPPFSPEMGLWGAQLQCLWRCYHDQPAAARFYGGGGLWCCHFGGKLLFWGQPRGQELVAFARFAGAQVLEGPWQWLQPAAAEAGLLARRQPVLAYAGAASPAPPAPADVKQCLSLWRQTGLALSPRQADEALSDLNRRVRLGVAACYGDGSCALAALAIGCGHVVLGGLATRPDCRGQGRASRLLQAAAGYWRGAGYRVVLLPASPALAGFYRRRGFVPAGAVGVLALLAEDTD